MDSLSHDRTHVGHARADLTACAEATACADSPAGANSPDKGERWLLALVLLAALLVRLPDLGDPWAAAGHRDAHGASYTGPRARNFAEHGFLASGLLPVNWRVVLDDGELVQDRYAHHPASYAVLEGLALKAFGTREWALELPSLVFSLAGIWSAWRAIRTSFGPRVALRAAALLAVLPLSAWYGPQAWSTSAESWLHGLLLWRWLRWTRHSRARDLAFASAYSFGCGLLDWNALWVLPGLGVHAAFVARRARSWRRLLAAGLLPLGALAAIALHWLHLELVLPSGHALSEGSAMLDHVTALEVPAGRFLAIQLTLIERTLTWPALALAAAGAAALGLRALRGRAAPGDALALAAAGAAALGLRALRGRAAPGDALAPLAFLPGLLSVLAFPFRSMNHEFFWFGALPGFAAFAALGLDVAQRRIGAAPGLDVARRRSGAELWGRATALALLGAVALVSLWRLAWFRDTLLTERVSDLAQAAWIAPRIRDERAVVLATTGMGSRLGFYSSAPVIPFVDSPEALADLHRRVLSRLGPGRPVVLVADLTVAAAVRTLFARPPAGIEPDIHVLGSPPGPERAFAVFDLCDWDGRFAPP